MSLVVAIGTFLLLLFCVLDVVGVATNYWMTMADTFRLTKSHAGLFKICYKVVTMRKEMCSYNDQLPEIFLRGKNGNFCNCVYACFICMKRCS